MLSNNDIIKHGHAFPESDILERPSDPHLGDMIRRGSNHVAKIFCRVLPFVELFHFALRVIPHIGLVIEANLPITGLINTSDNVEARGLTGTVRTDECYNLPFVDLQGKIIHSHHTAKLHGDIFKL